MENKDTGILLNENNIKLHRNYFNEMVRLLGIQTIYRAPRENKTYNGYGELDSFYYEPVVVGCLFEEHPTQKTMRKLGWASELQESMSVIHVPYDLQQLQVGAIFIIPSAVDKAKGRVFKVINMSTISVYPASVSCEIAPIYETTFENSSYDHSKDDFNLLADEEKEID